MNGLTIRITLILLTFKHKLLQVPELFGPGLHQPLLEREAFRSSAQHDPLMQTGARCVQPWVFSWALFMSCHKLGSEGAYCGRNIYN